MTASSSQRRYGATARAHRAQGTQNRPVRDGEPAPPWPRHPEPEGDWDRRSLLHGTTCGNRNGSHRRRCATQADQEHLTARIGYKSPIAIVSRWSGRYSEARKPRNKGGAGAHRHKARDESKGQPTPAPGRRATEKHSTEYPKRLVEAEARTKGVFRKENTHVGCPEELHRAPTKPWRTRETPPEGWQTGQDPRTTRNYASSVRTQENGRTQHFRARTVRIDTQSVNVRDGETSTRRQGDIHAKRKGRCQEQCPDRYARNQKPLASLPCVEDQRTKTPRWKESPWGHRSRPIAREGREATGPEEEGPRPTLSLARGTHTESMPEAKTLECGTHSATEQTGRPKGGTKTLRGLAGKTAPNSPTAVIPSFEIRSSHPDLTGVTPSWRKTDQLSKVKLRYDRVWEKHTRPAGWPHREATKDRWTEEAYVPIEGAEKRHTTRNGWPHRKGLAPTTREGAQRVFVPIEIWDKLDPTGWPHREDSNQTPGRWRKRLRSDRGLRQAWPGRVAPSQRLDAKTEAEIPKELRFRTLEVGQLGEAGEHTPEPTNWRGHTTNRHSQSWDSTDETSRDPSMDVRPAGMRQRPDRKAISHGALQWARKQGGLQLAPHKHQNVTKRENGEGRLDGSQFRGARSNQTPRPEKSNPGEGATTNPGWEHPRKDREEVNQNSTTERTGRPNPHENPKGFLTGRRHWIRQ